jgi:hypothetical protein
MQRQAIGGGVTIGIVVYSGWGDQLRAASLAGLWRDQGKVRVERGAEVRPGEFQYELTGASPTPIRGVSRQPLLGQRSLNHHPRNDRANRQPATRITVVKAVPNQTTQSTVGLVH